MTKISSDTVKSNTNHIAFKLRNFKKLLRRKCHISAPVCQRRGLEVRVVVNNGGQTKDGNNSTNCCLSLENVILVVLLLFGRQPLPPFSKCPTMTGNLH